MKLYIYLIKFSAKVLYKNSIYHFSDFVAFKRQWIPPKPLGGCPKNTLGCNTPNFGCPNTCYCEDHCSWKKCTLYSPPYQCLTGIDGEWVWNDKRQYWVAQVDPGI